MEKAIDFENGNTGKCLMKMVIPLFIAMILMLAYNLVDSIWVGNLLGENGYAALTTAGTVSMILYAIATGAGNGTSVVVSLFVGTNNKGKTEQVITTALFVSFLFSVSIVLILEALLQPMLHLFRTPQVLYTDVWIYLKIFLLGYIPIFVYMQLTSIFRSFGDPMFQMKGMILGTLINIIADPIFIKMAGVSGAAMATVLSQVICLVYGVMYGKKKSYFSLQKRGFSRKYVIELIRTAVPTSIQSLIPAISSMIMVILINRLNVTTIAAYGVIKNVENILFYPAMAMNMALLSIIGQLYGAKCYGKIKEYMKASVWYGVCIELILVAGVLVFSRQISMLFVREINIAMIVSRGLMIIGFGYICYMLTNIMTAKMAAFGKVNLSMILMAIYYIGIRIPLVVILMNHTPLGLDGMWIAILASHIAAMGLAFLINQNITKIDKN